MHRPSRHREVMRRGRPKSESDRVLTISELARYLRVSRTKIYHLVKDHSGNTFPAFRVGRSWRINLYDFQDWMCRQLETETDRKKAKMHEG